MIWAFRLLVWLVPLPLVVYWRTDIPGRRRPGRSLPLAPPRCNAGASCPADWRCDGDPVGWVRVHGAGSFSAGLDLGSYRSPPARPSWAQAKVQRAGGHVVALCSPKRDQGGHQLCPSSGVKPHPGGNEVAGRRGRRRAVRQRQSCTGPASGTPPTPAGSSLYVIPRYMLFQQPGPLVWEFLRELVGSSGVDR